MRLLPSPSRHDISRADPRGGWNPNGWILPRRLFCLLAPGFAHYGCGVGRKDNAAASAKAGRESGDAESAISRRRILFGSDRYLGHQTNFERLRNRHFCKRPVLASAILAKCVSLWQGDPLAFAVLDDCWGQT